MSHVNLGVEPLQTLDWVPVHTPHGDEPVAESVDGLDIMVVRAIAKLVRAFDYSEGGRDRVDSQAAEVRYACRFGDAADPRHGELDVLA